MKKRDSLTPKQEKATQQSPLTGKPVKKKQVADWSLNPTDRSSVEATGLSAQVTRRGKKPGRLTDR